MEYIIDNRVVHARRLVKDEVIRTNRGHFRVQKGSWVIEGEGGVSFMADHVFRRVASRVEIEDAEILDDDIRVQEVLN